MRILETALYAENLAETGGFYGRVLGLERLAEAEGRHVFFRAGEQVLLPFNPQVTRRPPGRGNLPVPRHGATGPGHVCFAATAAGIDRWVVRLAEHGVPIEADLEWPQGGRSIYFRDPAGNSVESAEPRIWGLSEA